MTRKIITWGSVASALAAIITLYTLLGGPRPAWTSDVQRLDRAQADLAVQLYQGRIQSLLSVQPPTDPVARQNWDEQLREQRRKLDKAQERQIELSK